jgi:hypothetical protein
VRPPHIPLVDENGRPQAPNGGGQQQQAKNPSHVLDAETVKRFQQNKPTAKVIKRG